MEVEVVVKDDRAGARQGQVPRLTQEQIPAALEALLLTLDRPVSALKLAEALGLAEPRSEHDAGASAKTRRRKPRDGDSPADAAAVIESTIAELNRQYDTTGRSFRIESVAGGFRLMTRPEFAPIIAAYH